MTVDADFLRQRALDVQRHVRSAREIAAMSDEAFMADERAQLALSHVLLVGIEAAATMCTHVSARMLRRAPATYGDCVDEMAAAGVVDAALAGRLRAMMRFRNLLVHQYWDIDVERVLRYARHELGDLEDYVAAMGRYVGGEL